MVSKRRLRIPFSAAVDCGLAQVGVARNISENGILTEWRVSRSDLPFSTGTLLELTISPFWKWPEVRIRVSIVRVEDHADEEGNPQTLMAAEFRSLPKEARAELGQQIDAYSEHLVGMLESCMNDYKDRTPANDLVELGAKLIELSDCKILSTKPWARNLRTFLSTKDPKTLGRYEQAMRRKTYTGERILGRILLAELALRTLVDRSQHGSLEEDRSALQRELERQVRSLQEEFYQASEGIQLTEFEVRKEIAKAVSRLASTLEQETTRLGQRPK